MSTRINFPEVFPIVDLLRKYSAKDFNYYQNRGKAVYGSSVPSDAVFVTLVNDSLSPHSLINTAVLAFTTHLPFILDVEDVFLIIIQAINRHVQAHAETLRPKFVSHQGKIQITVERGGFDLFTDDEHEFKQDWMAIVQEMTDKMKVHSNLEVIDDFQPKFSSLTPVHRTINLMSIMSICQQYFKYKLQTMCGFPYIDLKGTVEDWEELKTRVTHLLETYCLPEFMAAWAPILLPLLQKIIETVQGKECDLGFWESFVKKGGGQHSGSRTQFTGWFNIFFPTLEDVPNPYCVPWSTDLEHLLKNDTNNMHGPDAVCLYGGVDTTPFIFGVGAKEYPMEIRHGFLGTRQHANGALEAEKGWVIVGKWGESL